MVFHRQFAWALDFLNEVHPSRAALQPRLDGPAWKGGQRLSHRLTHVWMRHGYFVGL